MITLREAQSPPFLYTHLLQLFERRDGGDSWSTGDPAGVGADCPHSLQTPSAHNRPAVDTSKIGTTTAECAAHAVGFSQFKPHRTMASSTFPELLTACTDPDNGTIRWSTACQAAQDHNLWAEFCAAYGTVPFRVDTGELLEWLGY